MAIFSGATPCSMRKRACSGPQVPAVTWVLIGAPVSLQAMATASPVLISQSVILP